MSTWYEYDGELYNLDHVSRIYSNKNEIGLVYEYDMERVHDRLEFCAQEAAEEEMKYIKRIIGL